MILPLLWTTEMVCSSTSGTDATYSLTRTPSSPTKSLLVYINGVLQRYTTDYTVSGKNIIFAAPVGAGRNIIANYSYNRR